MIVKICGLHSPGDVECVNNVRPDMAGFVFHPPSRRHVTAERAAELSAMLDPSILPVGVFVDESQQVISDLVESGVIRAVQLHGSEDPGYIEELRGLVDVPIIKAFEVRSEKDVESARNSNADLVLLDAGKGSGRVFDWDLAVLDRPFILSGGLTPDNVAEAVGRIRPYGVDVSSGVETGGSKDPEKVRSFVARAQLRSADIRFGSRAVNPERHPSVSGTASCL